MEFTQIIYSTYLTKKGRDKIKEKMQKNEKFKVTSQNIEEFVEDMNFITNILKENHIEYKIKVEDEWLNSDAVITRYNYRTRIDIYLKKIDYEKIKPKQSKHKKLIKILTNLGNYYKMLAKSFYIAVMYMNIS